MLQTSQVFKNLSADALEKAEIAYEKAEDLRDKYDFDYPEVSHSCSIMLSHLKYFGDIIALCGLFLHAGPTVLTGYGACVHDSQAQGC
jgi:hypothetical protein